MQKWRDSRLLTAGPPRAGSLRGPFLLLHLRKQKCLPSVAIPMAELFRRGLRLGPSRSAADAGGVRQIQFCRGTKNSAADSADCRGTNLFCRGSDRIRGGLAELPPAECTEKGPRESATRIFRECPPRTFEKFRLRGTIPRLTTVPRNHSAANNRVAEPFRG